ncbi:MAG: ABC transporter ATP-binding protein [Pseudomonadota bacterium]
MPNIVFDKVEKTFDSVRVLQPLDLDLANGEFTVLVGPSGCGKSTMLRILAGLETLSGGEIYFDGKPISALEPKDRDIAMVFQDYALYPHMNVARNMSFALHLARVSKSEIREKVTRVAEMLNIGHLLDRKPAELSGGQRQRVAMGRALVRDAGTFLFDEPLSNLDAKLRARMRTELAEMRDRIDKNMIYVTHDQIEAMTLGDRIVVMNEGVIQQQGSAEELFENPVNLFVAGFIGTPTMNFLDGVLHHENGALRVQGNGYDLPIGAETGKRLSSASKSGAVTIGIRPSSFQSDPADGTPIEMNLKVSEYLGTLSVLVAECGGTELQVEVAGSAPETAGTALTFGVRPDDIIVFDAESGLAL